MLVAAESGLSSQRIFPSHAQNFFVFWKRPAERAIIPHVKLCEIGDANQLAHNYFTAHSAPSAGNYEFIIMYQQVNYSSCYFGAVSAAQSEQEYFYFLNGMLVYFEVI